MGSQAAGSPLSVVVIGHVDHGKTALVRALTGIETDRLAQEKARGLSMTLGFAWREYPAGTVDLLDAPGHEDFLRAMVMGATGARAALLVVSANEGFGRQTREHLRIAELLGVRAGVVAVAKADLLPEGGEASLQAAVADELKGTFLAGEPVVFCSAQTGTGLPDLHAALEDLLGRCPPGDPFPGAILPIDRVFSVAGSGTVVTGTLQGGPLHAGVTAELMPSGRPVTLRGLQTHGEWVEAAPAGGRMAASLRGVSVDEVQVGEALATPGALAPSLLVDVELALLGDSARPLKSGDKVRVMWGARQDMARVRLLDQGPLVAGAHGLAQLRFTRPVAVFAGQRAILRRPSPAETIGGALVLDPVAPNVRRPLDARRALLEAAAARDLQRIVEALAARDGGVLSAGEAARLSRRSPDEVRARLRSFEALGPDLLAFPAAVAGAREAYLLSLAEAHRNAPHRAWVPVAGIRAALARTLSPHLLVEIERRLAAGAEIRLRAGQVSLATHDPLASLQPAALASLRDLEGQVREGGVAPPDLRVLTEAGSPDAELVELLIDLGVLVALRNHALRQTVIFHAEALDQALANLRAAFPKPAEFTTGAARAALGTSRKFIVPILELFDARGDTVRDGDLRRLV